MRVHSDVDFDVDVDFGAGTDVVIARESSICCFVESIEVVVGTLKKVDTLGCPEISDLTLLLEAHTSAKDVTAKFSRVTLSSATRLVRM